MKTENKKIELDSLGRKKSPRIADKRMSIKQTKERKKKINQMIKVGENIRKVEEVQEQLFEIWKTKLPEIKQERVESFKKLINDFTEDNQEQIIKLGGKIDTEILNYALSKTIVSPDHRYMIKKYSYKEISEFGECYWDCVREIQNNGIFFIPSIRSMTKLMNISLATFMDYYYNGDTKTREVISIIKDEFISFIERNALARKIDTITGIFINKAVYGLRDSDPVQQVTNNLNIISTDKEKERSLLNSLGIVVDDNE